jgi:RNA polymerase sigma-70 factor (ECF subfamily)
MGFVTTQWATVLLASREGEAQLKALEQLCRVYWYPLYAYIRRRGHSPEDAKDLTQEFFERLLSKNWLAKAAPEAGRFRTFLLTALNRFLANEYDRTHALKRGGGTQILPLDGTAAEAEYQRELPTAESPDKLFERRWALALLDQALNRLRQEIVAAGKGPQLEVLNPFLSREPEHQEYEEIAAQLGMSRSGVAVTVYRLRQRCREVLRDEVAATLADPSQIDEEMRYILTALLA